MRRRGVTPAEAISYEVHLSREEAFEPGDTTLWERFTGVVQGDLSGLAPATTYQVLMIAVDGDGNRSREREYHAITTFDSAALLNDQERLLYADQLGLGEPERAGSLYRFPTTDAADRLEGGALLVGPVGEVGYLRRIDTISTEGGETRVETSPAALSEALSRGGVRNVQRLFSVAEAARSDALRRIASASVSKGADGDRQSRVAWRDGLLSARQTDFVIDRAGLEVRPADQEGRYRVRGGSRALTADGSSEVTFDAQVGFTPELVTDVVWTEGEEVERAEVLARGTLSLEVEAAYDFSGAASYQREFALFERTYTSLYAAGPVPVYQQITLSMRALVSADAGSEVAAAASSGVSTTVEVGVRYNTTSREWDPVVTTGFSRSLTADLGIQGRVNAQVRLIPEVSVEFYDALSATLSVEPYLNGDIAAASLSGVDLVGGTHSSLTQLTNFDFLLGVECYVSAELDVLITDITLLERTALCGPEVTGGWALEIPEYPLFDLPRMELDLAGGGTPGVALPFALRIDDGTNNPFQFDSLRWEVDPAGAQIVVTEREARGASGTTFYSELNACEGEYTVYASGYGRLGELGRRYAVGNVTFAAGLCELRAAVSPATVRGAKPLSVTLDGSTSFDPAGRIVHYAWRTSDGRVAEGDQVSFEFPEAGSYEVTLEVTNGAGESASAVAQVYVAECTYSANGGIDYRESCDWTEGSRAFNRSTTFDLAGMATDEYTRYTDCANGCTPHVFRHRIWWPTTGGPRSFQEMGGVVASWFENGVLSRYERYSTETSCWAPGSRFVNCRENGELNATAFVESSEFGASGCVVYTTTPERGEGASCPGTPRYVDMVPPSFPQGVEWL